ncbi:MAG: helical backbone metal receptor [Gemmatimonadaceae bacterium]
MHWPQKLRVAELQRIKGALLLAVIAATAFTAACSSRDSAAFSSSTTAAAADTDDFGARISHDSAVGARVISLVPAATEIIFAIGRGSRLVGRTTWDLYPDSARQVPNVGDGMRPNVEIVLAAKPTLVVIYASAENRAAAASFTKAGIAVLAIRVDRIADFGRLTKILGSLLGATDRARNVVDSVTGTLNNVRAAVVGTVRPTVVWPLWDAPVLVVGSGSFLAELLDIAGGKNAFADLDKPSPEVSVEEIAHRNPALVVASPLSIKRLAMSPQWQSVKAIRDKQFREIDTVVVGRPTVTLGMAAVSLAKLLHPERAAGLP